MLSINVTSIAETNVNGTWRNYTAINVSLYKAEFQNVSYADSFVTNSSGKNISWSNCTFRNNIIVNTTLVNSTFANILFANSSFSNVSLCNSTQFNLSFVGVTVWNWTLVNVSSVNESTVNATFFNSATVHVFRQNTAMLNVLFHNVILGNVSEINGTHLNVTYVNSTMSNWTLVDVLSINSSSVNVTNCNCTFINYTQIGALNMRVNKTFCQQINVSVSDSLFLNVTYNNGLSRNYTFVNSNISYVQVANESWTMFLLQDRTLTDPTLINGRFDIAFFFPVYGSKSVSHEWKREAIQQSLAFRADSFVSFVPSFPPTYALCPFDWVFYGGHCYKIRFPTSSWYRAMELCSQSKSSHLVVLNTPEEQDFLISHANSGYWIGNRYIEGEWSWRHGSWMLFSRWLCGFKQPTPYQSRRNPSGCARARSETLFSYCYYRCSCDYYTRFNRRVQWEPYCYHSYSFLVCESEESGVRTV